METEAILLAQELLKFVDRKGLRQEFIREQRKEEFFDEQENRELMNYVETY